MTRPFVAKAQNLGAAAVYVMDDWDGNEIPDSSGNGRGAMQVSAEVQFQTSPVFPALPRVAWFSGGPGVHAWVPWAAWMDLGTTFTWAILARGGFHDQRNQASFATLASIGNGRWFIRHNGHRQRDMIMLVRDGNEFPADDEVIVTLPSSSWETRGWHLFGIRSVAAQPEGWVDGKLKVTGHRAASGVDGLDDPLVVGARWYQGSYDRRWRGHVAALVGFPTALSAADMLALYDTLDEETIPFRADWRLFRAGVRRFARLYLPDNIGIEPDPPPEPETPAVPTGVIATGGDQEGIVEWSAVPDATGYEVRWREAGAAWPGTPQFTSATSPHTIPGLEHETDYETQVQATNAAGESGWSSTATFRTDDAPEVPVAAVEVIAVDSVGYGNWVTHQVPTDGAGVAAGDTQLIVVGHATANVMPFVSGWDSTRIVEDEDEPTWAAWTIYRKVLDAGDISGETVSIEINDQSVVGRYVLRGAAAGFAVGPSTVRQFTSTLAAPELPAVPEGSFVLRSWGSTLQTNTFTAPAGHDAGWYLDGEWMQHRVAHLITDESGTVAEVSSTAGTATSLVALSLALGPED